MLGFRDILVKIHKKLLTAAYKSRFISKFAVTWFRVLYKSGNMD